MEQLEVERKFDIARDAPLPSLDGVVEVGPTRTHRMRAVYLDTADLLLVRHKVTLRRREGGSDEGWHLKLPRGSARLEVHAPLLKGPGRMRVPDGHRHAVAEALPDGLPEGAAGTLVPAAVLRTVRQETDLLDERGRVVAQLCDDHVSALPEGRRWREVEVELVEGGPGDEALLDRIATALLAQGLAASASPSKLARALGDRPRRAEAGAGPTPDDSAGEVVRAYLLEQVSVILGREAGLRVDAPDAVHKSRVAARRLRSALRTFRRLLDREVTDPVREELRWWGEVLGAPRDAEVLRARVGERVRSLPSDLVRGPVVGRVEGELAGRHARGHAVLVEELDGERYLALTDALVDLVAEPPWRGRARRSARAVLPGLVEKAAERAAKEHGRAGLAEGADRLHLLHETRKRAKAARYGWEAIAPVFGGSATEHAEAWEQVTETLGAMQDASVAAARLRELVEDAEEAGEPTLTYAVLLGRELEAQERAALDGERAMDDALL